MTYAEAAKAAEISSRGPFGGARIVSVKPDGSYVSCSREAFSAAVARGASLTPVDYFNG